MASSKNLLDDKSTVATHEPIPQRKSCTGYCVYKLLTILYSIFFIIVGLLLLGIGVWVVIIKEDYVSIHDVLTSPALLMCVVGALMVTTALIGIIGAALDKLWPMRIFLAIVIIVFILQVVIGIVAFIFREQTIEVIDKRMRWAIDKYTENDNVRSAVDKVQQKFECCGLNNVSDWNSSIEYSCTNQASRKSCSIPDSCCKQMNPGCGLNVKPHATVVQLLGKGIHMSGCRWAFLRWLEKNLDIVGATALGFAILHILGIFVVYMFITKVEDRIRLFQYRKRYYDS